MKRHFTPPSSMELLLDAMCNVFGAVLFAAILIGGVSIARNLALTEDQVDAAAFAAAQAELQLLNDQLKTVNMECELLNNLPKNPRTASSLNTSLQKRCNDLIRQLNLLASELEKLSREVDSMQQDLSLAQKFASNIPQNRQLLLEHKNQLLYQLENSHAAPLEISSLQYTDKLQPWRLLVTSQEIFVIGSNHHIRSRNSIDNAVEIKVFDFNDFDYFQLRKRSGSGIALSDFVLNESTLPPVDNQQYFIEILTEPDAIRECALLLKSLRADRWAYHWRIVPADGIILSTGTGSKYEMVR